VGISCFPEDGETTEALLTTAARNMQNDKNIRKTMATISATPAAVAIDALR
jgi:hypothetical protein